MNALSNKRHPDETQADYRARRKVIGQQLARYLAGRMVHKATDIVQLPAAGINIDIDRAVRSGQYRDLQTVFAPGEVSRVDLPGCPTEPRLQAARIGRTKGVSYRRYPKVADRKRGYHRKRWHPEKDEGTA